MANIITSCRIFLSAILLFSQVFSPCFYICYLTAGFSDMIDGTIARKLGTASSFGEKLDSAADLVFVVVVAIKLLPVLDIPAGIIIWTGIIALIKIINLVSGVVRHKQFVTVHSIANKLTGLLLFALPLTLTVIPLQYSGMLVCTVATAAAIQEGHLIRTKENSA